MNELILGPETTGWIWDGTQWVCRPDCPPPCPPPAGPPPWYPPPQGQPPWYPGANGGVFFSQTPPANPCRGAFWFDGNALHLFDGTAWVDIGVQGAASGGGTATGNNPPANPVNGSMWWNGTALMIWDSNAWVPVSQTKVYMQATAPAAPNPGDQWWNGTQMFIYTGSAWANIGPGATVGPTPTTTEVFAINAPATIAVPANVWGILPFNTIPLIDTQNGWDRVTNRYTPTKPGVYLFSILSDANLGAQGYGGIQLLKNDNGSGQGEVVCMSVTYETVGAGCWVQASAMVRMNGVADFVRMYCYSASAGIVGFGNSPMMEAWLMP